MGMMLVVVVMTFHIVRAVKEKWRENGKWNIKSNYISSQETLNGGNNVT